MPVLDPHNPSPEDKLDALRGLFYDSGADRFVGVEDLLLIFRTNPDALQLAAEASVWARDALGTCVPGLGCGVTIEAERTKRGIEVLVIARTTLNPADAEKAFERLNMDWWHRNKHRAHGLVSVAYDFY